MKTLTQEQIATLEEVTRDMDCELRSYSGRAMFGKRCLAIVIHGPSDTLALGVTIAKTDLDLADILTETRVRLDTMGGDREVIYWEGISAEGLNDDEDEED